jgi:glycine/D-amino acid oxidase-like deaminating enzyme
MPAVPHDWGPAPHTCRRQISRIKNTKGVSRGPAGSIHPHKLATHFLKAAMASGQVDFYSWAPVKHFTERKDGQGWDVEVINRGTIKAKQVIVCTNAHTRHLFPGQAIDKQ